MMCQISPSEIGGENIEVFGGLLAQFVFHLKRPHKAKMALWKKIGKEKRASNSMVTKFLASLGIATILLINLMKR
ncbi:hypothetical protein L6452_18561 [Arctium lappa]|uniref:Uncharacterized protein n=1 Tax=Arctium lappa TaxID=4217 RepID=A0ACB9C6I9_ARCLA|nr:hypothetical protein L6452_18561 [Arctium lappa]